MRASGYSMDIYCDAPDCYKGGSISDGKAEYGSFNGQRTETSCIKAARKDGWQIGTHRDLCPKCRTRKKKS